MHNRYARYARHNRYTRYTRCYCYRWVDDPALRMAAQSRGTVTLLQAEVMSALADLSLSVLDHPLLTRTHVHERLSYTDVQPYATGLARALLERFEPSKPTVETDFVAALDGVLKAIELNVTDEESRQLLRAMASAVRCTIRTNAFIESRWALTLRIDPTFFGAVLPPSPTLSNKPFGVFFCSGRHFSAYHVRFSDIARGGLRLVLPPSVDAHLAESRRHFQVWLKLL